MGIDLDVNKEVDDVDKDPEDEEDVYSPIQAQCPASPLVLVKKELQSLKGDLLTKRVLSELLGVCSQTLNKLDVDLVYSLYKVQGFF